MKKVNFLQTLWVLLALSIGFGSCSDDDDPTPDPNNAEVKTVVINATAYDKWVYFSFEKDTIVGESGVEETRSGLDWDIAFHRYDLRLNCGASGTGKGGTYNAGAVDFNSITEAPSEIYAANDSIEVSIPGNSFPPPTARVPGDSILGTWCAFSGPPPTYAYSKNVFVVKTATGKYAKLMLLDFFNDDAESGHVTMKYLYQPDGSTNLE